MLQAQKDLRKFASLKKSKHAMRFFKTGAGQYGEGDQFIGATVPETRSVAQNYSDMGFKDLAKLLKSPIHEDRFLALAILTKQFAKSKDPKVQKQIFDFYLKNRAGINNWDLVDLSAPNIVGEYCRLTNSNRPILKLAKSKRHWDRRIAMVASFSYIRAQKLDLVWKLAKMFLKDKEDLMHKATGWMLREAGKRDEKLLRKFIATNGPQMPRTMLRYSIEKFSKTERLKILKSSKIQ